MGLFDKVSQCFKEEMGKEEEEMAKNIRCDWCGFLVEDLWETIIGGAFSAQPPLFTTYFCRSPSASSFAPAHVSFTLVHP